MPEDQDEPEDQLVCIWEDEEYSEGAEVCQGGVLKECRGGAWHTLGRCPTPPPTGLLPSNAAPPRSVQELIKFASEQKIEISESQIINRFSLSPSRTVEPRLGELGAYQATSFSSDGTGQDGYIGINISNPAANVSIAGHNLFNVRWIVDCHFAYRDTPEIYVDSGYVRQMLSLRAGVGSFITPIMDSSYHQFEIGWNIWGKPEGSYFAFIRADIAVLNP